MTLDIPAGVENGNMLRFSTEHGDVIIICQVSEDPLFTRDGNDLHVTVPISVKTALLGGIVKIPTLKGTVDKKVLPGTQPYDVERLNGGGVGGIGNLYIHYRLIIPRSLSKGDQELIRKTSDDGAKTTQDMWNANLTAFETRMIPYRK
jgi:molecular chaperone DnaJ